MDNLTIAKVKSITEPGRYGDGGTLFLLAKPSGSKSWVQRLTIHGVRRDIGLGGFPLVSLSEARVKAFENRKLARIEGGDPLAGKRKARMPTFREAAEKAHKANRARWRADKHAKNWLQSLKRYAFPSLGNIPVDRISGQDVLRILGPIWSTRTDTARRIRQRIRTVLGWCLAHGYVTSNAAAAGIDGALPVISTGAKNFRALPFGEVAAALETVEASKASWSAKWALRFLVLTAARSGEVRGATWSEVDLEAKEWRIPAERMKGHAEHRVPLSAEALAVLEQARTLDDGSGLVFPSPMRRGRPLSSMSLTKVLRDNGLATVATVHGFRTSFRTWASEKTNADHAVMELSLAHRVGSAVEQAYARSDLLTKRRRLMNQWAAYLTGRRAGKVVNFRG